MNYVSLMCEPLGLSSLVFYNSSIIKLLTNKLAISYQVKTIFIMYPAIPFLGIYYITRVMVMCHVWPTSCFVHKV